ncbi:mechanosensitive ion channel [Saccharophagus degradans]|uniref:mechanosensitive ion channel domain-containing protein n=1 Tax=Saccharophagus degradans TaxID=86304 RepID=UPI002477FAD8|nr:mechanosensitive ion channel domain-containing protein [Saccharophagus degradans]WGO96571.1 mechanosensitive ion channel [Saccharophagus degradans]
MEHLDRLIEIATSRGLVTTFLILAAAVIGRWTIRRFIVKNDALSPTLKAKWGKLAQNLIVFLTLFALVLEWAPQLRTFALSLTAVAVAIVIALKEIILCLTGAVMRTSSSVKVGDVIDIQGCKGRAVELTLLSSIIAQLNDDDLPTGRRITLPNSVFLSNHFATSKANTKLIPLNISFVMEPNYMLANKVKEELGLALNRVWESVQASPAFSQAVSAEFSDNADFEPTIRLTTANDAKLAFKIHILCAPEDRNNVESNLSESFFTIVSQLSRKPD